MARNINDRTSSGIKCNQTGDNTAIREKIGRTSNQVKMTKMAMMKNVIKIF